MNTDALLLEMFDLFIMVQIKGVPYALSSYRDRITEISRDLLEHYKLPEGKGFERIFMDLSGMIELPDGLIDSVRQKLSSASAAFRSGLIANFDQCKSYYPGLSREEFSAFFGQREDDSNPGNDSDHSSPLNPRPIISEEVFRYVQDRLPFPLSEEEIVEIENGFVLRWNYSEGQRMGDLDMKLAVEHYLTSQEKYYDKKLVEKVVDLMLEYLELIGQWKKVESVRDHRKPSTVVHFSLLLAVRYPEFMTGLSDCLITNGTPYHFLPETSDIWCRDYMPVRVRDNRFVQFVYNPDYLKPDEGHLKTDPWKVTLNLPVEIERSSLVIDGGNVVRQGNTVILTDKIFRDNPGFRASRQQLIQELAETLEADRIVIIPKEPWDPYGHADGMVRFVNENQVIINNYLEADGYSASFIRRLKRALESRGLTIAGTLPYRYFKSIKPANSAIGCYMNYLEINDLLIFPQFNIPEDQPALTAIHRYFPKKKILPLNCTEIAIEGGVLNCVSWECEFM